MVSTDLKWLQNWVTGVCQYCGSTTSTDSAATVLNGGLVNLGVDGSDGWMVSMHGTKALSLSLGLFCGPSLKAQQGLVCAGMATSVETTAGPLGFGVATLQGDKALVCSRVRLAGFLTRSLASSGRCILEKSQVFTGTLAPISCWGSYFLVTETANLYCNFL